jgi:hypothetical protein
MMPWRCTTSTWCKRSNKKIWSTPNAGCINIMYFYVFIQPFMLFVLPLCTLFIFSPLLRIMPQTHNCCCCSSEAQ